MDFRRRPRDFFCPVLLGFLTSKISDVRRRHVGFPPSRKQNVRKGGKKGKERNGSAAAAAAVKGFRVVTRDLSALQSLQTSTRKKLGRMTKRGTDQNKVPRDPKRKLRRENGR